MEQEVQLPPVLLDALENLLSLALGVNIERHEDRRFQFPGQRLDVFLRAVVQIGNGQFRSKGTECLGAAPGNRLVVRDADNQALSSLERDLGLRKYGDVHDALSFSWTDGRVLHNNDIVCWAIISSSSVGTT